MNICIINCFDTYEHRVELLKKIFLKEGHNVQVLTSDFKHIEKKQRTDIKEGYVFFSAKPYRRNLSIDRLYSHSKLSRDIFDYVENDIDNIELLWVLVPPNSFVKDSVKVKKKYPDVKLVFDLIDLWPETMPIGGAKNYWPFIEWKKLRDNGLNVADYVVTECEMYKDKLVNILHGVRTETLYLARPLSEYIPKVNLTEDKVNLCYLGSMNNIIDIDTIGNIIRDFKKIKSVELHLIGTGERKRDLIKKVEKNGAKVVDHGIVYDRATKQKIFDCCHYGLNIMKSSVCVGLTMKSMDYFEFGLPIINNISGDTWEACEKYGFGINYEKNRELYIVDDECRVKARRFFEEYLTESCFETKLKNMMETL